MRSIRAQTAGILFVATSLPVLGWLAEGCGSDTGGFSPTPDGSLTDGNSVQDAPPPFPTDADACTNNLKCQVVDCGAGKSTTVSGTVYDPKGRVPLYNVIVYVPNAPLLQFPAGVTCDTCGALVSGNPVT